MEQHIMYERERHTPFEVASDPEAFADTYAELCGIIPINDLVDLYHKAFPELPMDYATMREAAAQRRPAQSERKNRVFSAKRQAVWFETHSVSN